MKTLTTLIIVLLAGTLALAAESNRNVPGAFGKFDSTIVGNVRKATAGREQDPLKYLTSDMSDIVTDLEAYQTGQVVQDKQAKVVDRLDALIKMLESQCNGSGSRSGANPTKPLDHSKIIGGPGGGSQHAIKEGDKSWANLPPKTRDQILQSKTEGFPQGYENVLQSYFKRLSQQKVTEEPDENSTTGK